MVVLTYVARQRFLKQKKSFPAALRWQKKAVTFEIPGPQKPERGYIRQKRPFKTALLFPLDRRANMQTPKRKRFPHFTVYKYWKARTDTLSWGSQLAEEQHEQIFL